MSDKRVSKDLSLIANSSLLVLGGALFSKFLSYFYRVIIARSYGPEEYGLFTLATTVIGIATAIALFGTAETTIRFLSFYIGKKDMERAKYVFKYILLVSVSLSIILGFLLFFNAESVSYSLLKDTSLANYIKLFSIGMVFTVATRPYLGALRAFEHIGWYSLIFNVIQNIVKVLGIGILILIGYSSESVMISYFASIVATFFLTMIVVNYKIKKIVERIDKIPADFTLIKKELFSFSWPLLFYGVANLSFYWIDSLSLGYFKDATIVGLYNAASPLAMLVIMIPDMFMQLFTPLLTKHYALRKRKIIIEISKQINKWILILALPITIIILKIPDFLLNLLFGQAYLVATVPLSILLVGYLIFSLSYVSQNVLSIVGKTKILLISIIIGSLANIFLNILLIPLPNIVGLPNENGMNGAAIATLLSFCLLSCIYILGARYQLKAWPIRRKSLSVILAGIFAMSIAWIIEHRYLGEEMYVNNGVTLALPICMFLLLYSLFLYIFKSFDHYDLGILEKAIPFIKRLRNT